MLIVRRQWQRQHTHQTKKILFAPSVNSFLHFLTNWKCFPWECRRGGWEQLWFAAVVYMSPVSHHWHWPYDDDDDLMVFLQTRECVISQTLTQTIGIVSLRRCYSLHLVGRYIVDFTRQIMFNVSSNNFLNDILERSKLNFWTKRESERWASKKDSKHWLPTFTNT